MSGHLPGEENEFGDDYLDWSDDENIVCSSKYVISSSSDEEAERFLLSLKSKRLVKKAQVLDKRDDFEREMDSELSVTLQQLRAAFSKEAAPDTTASASQSNAPASSNDNKSSDESKEFYDEIYFDSDDSDSEELMHKPSGSVGGRGNRRILSNDELFYDPKMDDRDQAWVDKMRRSYQVKNKKRLPGSPKSSKNPESLPESDAVLNCPACLTMLCMDCQRHEIYHNQYRAMFVFNCNVNWMEVLKFPKKTQKKKEYFRNKKKAKKAQEQVEETTSGQQEAAQVDANTNEKSEDVLKSNPSQKEDSALADSTTKIQLSGQELELSVSSNNSAESSSLESNSDELFHPVMCKICNTKVAVYDKDEVYHFFNIVTSY